MRIKPTTDRGPARAHSDEYTDYLNSPQWQAVRTAALRRAGYRCASCGSDRRLEVHHTTYERLGGEAWGDLVVLCHGCHLAADRRRQVMGLTRRLKAAREVTR